MQNILEFTKTFSYLISLFPNNNPVMLVLLVSLFHGKGINFSKVPELIKTQIQDLNLVF